MPLTLTIRNAARLDNGSPLALVLDRRGATIGRAATNDWCIPDPSLHISSRHCEVKFDGGQYLLVDNSTNGTFLLGQGARLAAPHGIRQGDVFVIGQFEVAAALDDAAAAAAEVAIAAPQVAEWQGWGAAANTSDAAPAASASAWDARPAAAAISGGGPMSQAWAPPSTAASAPSGDWGAPAAPPSAPPSTWDVAPAPAPLPSASDWSSPAAPATPTPAGNDIWGQFAQSNVVDWARGGFGSPPPAPSPAPAAAPAPAPAADPFGLSSPPPAAPVSDPFGLPPATPAAEAAPAPAPAASAPAASGAGLAALAAAAGIDPARLKQGEAETLAQAGNLLRRLTSGLVVMLEARARAKSQMGAQGTNLEFDGNNPLKFARTPDQALAQLLNPAERGFMNTDRAIEDAFKDLQAHQMATLKAMQGALRSTLERFSPTAIRARAENKGMLGKILPTARDAALWAAYEKEFGGVAQGSDEAFMDVFAKEFRRAYEEMAAKR